MLGVFSRGVGTEQNITSHNSAVCVYSIKTIEEKFFENIRLCYNGHTKTVKKQINCFLIIININFYIYRICHGLILIKCVHKHDILIQKFFAVKM